VLAQASEPELPKEEVTNPDEGSGTETEETEIKDENVTEDSSPTDAEIQEEEEAQEDWDTAPVEDGVFARLALFSLPKTKLTVEKELINNDGGTGEYGDFSVTVTRHRIILPDQSETYSFDEDGAFTLNVVPTLSFGPFHQYYTVEETDADGYVTTYDNCDDLELSLGDHETCTVTNDDIAPIVPEGPQSCSIVSNETDYYLEGEHNAVFTWLHGAWTSVAGASWIWGDAEVADPEHEEIQTFTKDFNVSGTLTTAMLTLAADNGAVVTINGTEVINQDPNSNHYNPATSVDVASELHSGVNTIEVVVTNLEYNTTDPHTNPAGLIYSLDIEGADCRELPYEQEEPPVENSCVVPTGSADDIEFGPSGEQTLQQVLDGESYDIDADADQENFQTWDSDGSTVSFKATFITRLAGYTHTFGYYTGGDLGTFVPVFRDGTTPDAVPTAAGGQEFSFSVSDVNTPGVGFAVKAYSGDSLIGIWATDENQNSDGNDHAVVYNPESDIYVIAFDDQTGGSVDEDYNDIVVELSVEGCVKGESCDTEAEYTLLSSDSEGEDLVTTDEDGPASVVASLHASWLQQVGEWIWKDTSTSNDDAANGATETFTRTFDIVGTPKDSTLEMAVDNSAVVSINGVELVSVPGEFNYGATVSYPITASLLKNGENTITFEVTNIDHETANTPDNNPAGLLYKITVEENQCEVPPKEETATLHAVKIVCDDEADLPNWGAGNDDITSTTATTFLAEHPESCRVVPDWQFQWTTDAASNTNPGDNILTLALAPWETFGPTDGDGTIETDIPVGGKVWVREVLKEGYVPFSGQNTTEDVSAEMYCSTDVLNYDNWDWIDPVEANEDYYCIAFNARTPEEQICQEGEKWAETVVTSNQGDRKDGTDVLAGRSNTASVLGANDSVFYSLGFGGSITIKLDTFIADEAGDDLAIYETTNGTYPLETASVEVSQDGIVWESLTEQATNVGGPSMLDINETGLAWIKYVRLTDTTNSALHQNDADGFDLDAIKGINGVCDAPEPPAPTTATVIATKVMCDSEEYLPNMAGGADITSSTATDFVAANSDHCWLEDGYDFQWAPNGTSDPEDNGTTPLESPWTTFGPTNESGVTSVEVPVASVAGVIQVREVLKEGDVPFTGNSDDVSAELYCASDVAGYDNWEWIGSPSIGSIYYCVAFNAHPEDGNEGGGDNGEETFTYATTTVRMVDLAEDLGDVAANIESWFFYNDETDTIDSSIGSFVDGPETAPLGDGSAEMSVSGSQRRNLATYQAKDIKLADIKMLSFSTYSQSAGNGSPASERAPYLNFNVDFNDTDAWQNRLVFVPAVNGVVENDEWQNWDAIDGGDAMWCWSKMTSCGGSLTQWPDGNINVYRTWDELIAAFPNIQTRSTDSWFGFRVGEPYADGFTGNIDNFVIGVKTGTNIHTETYDFEPEEVESITPQDETSGGGSTSRTSSRRSSSSAGGEVLGATTECSALIDTYMSSGALNDSADVLDLQGFLNGEVNADLPLTGFFGPMTDAAVHTFQKKYWQDILQPWFAYSEYGIVSADDSTGVVYKTTKWKINNLVCPGSEVAPVLP